MTVDERAQALAMEFPHSYSEIHWLCESEVDDRLVRFALRQSLATRYPFTASTFLAAIHALLKR